MQKIKSRILSAMLMLPFVNNCVLSMQSKSPNFENIPEFSLKRTEYDLGGAFAYNDKYTRRIPTKQEYENFMEEKIYEIIDMNLKNYRMLNDKTGETFKDKNTRDYKFANYSIFLKPCNVSPITTNLGGWIIEKISKDKKKIDWDYDGFLLDSTKRKSQILEKTGYGICRNYAAWYGLQLDKLNGFVGLIDTCINIKNPTWANLNHVRVLLRYMGAKGICYAVADPSALADTCVTAIANLVKEKNLKTKPSREEVYKEMLDYEAFYELPNDSSLKGYLNCPLSEYLKNKKSEKELISIDPFANHLSDRDEVWDCKNEHLGWSKWDNLLKHLLPKKEIKK